MIHGPNLAHHLLLYIKFYWNMVMFIHLYAVSGCFNAVSELNICDNRLFGQQHLKYILSVPLQKMFSDFRFKVKISWRVRVGGWTVRSAHVS